MFSYRLRSTLQTATLWMALCAVVSAQPPVPSPPSPAQRDATRPPGSDQRQTVPDPRPADPTVPPGTQRVSPQTPPGTTAPAQPANATMQPIFVDPEHLQVQGKVVSVIRHL